MTQRLLPSKQMANRRMLQMSQLRIAQTKPRLGMESEILHANLTRYRGAFAPKNFTMSSENDTCTAHHRLTPGLIDSLIHLFNHYHPVLVPGWQSTFPRTVIHHHQDWMVTHHPKDDHQLS